MSYTIRETLSAFRRSPLLICLSIMSIAFSLFVSGLFGLATHNIRLAIEQIEERVEIVAYLHADLSSDQLRFAQEEIAALPEVADLQYVSRTEALAKAMRELPEFREVFADLETNPLPASLELRMAPGHRNTESVERVSALLAVYPFVEDVRYGEDWIQKIVFIRRVAAGIALVLGLAFAVVAVVTIAAAVRIAVYSRREEISIMRLVGATNGFIRRPFLLEGLASGVIGAGLAALLTFAAFETVNVSFTRIHWLPPEWVLGGLAAGAALGFLASAMAVRLHLGRD
jgi:cell division transport system permease protein